MKLLGGIALALALSPTAAYAQHISAGETRFNEARRRGLRLHAAGQHAEALRVFLGARTRFAGTPTELLGLMAQEQIETAQVAEGVRNATECVIRAETDVMNPRAATVRRQCVQLIEAVRSHLFSTTTEVRVGAVQIDAAAEAHPNLVVRVGGQEIPRSLWGQPIPVPEGRVTIQLSAPDAGVIRREVRIAAAQRQRLVVGATSSTPVTVEDTPIVQVEAPRTDPERVAAAPPARSDPGYGEVVLRVVDPPDGMGVAVGGFDLPRVWWGHPFPVRPGVVQVDADAQGHVRGRRRVQVAAGRRVEVEMQLQRVREEAPPPPPPVAQERSTPWVAVTMLGLGIGAAAAGGVLFGLARDRQDTLDASCTGPSPRTECDPGLRPLEQEGSTMTTAGNLSTIAGGALAVTGAIWWIVSAAQGRTTTEQPTETARMAQRVWRGRVP